ncbi:hypothetical protein E8E12_008813 [Didymella heteroderae]|uniref:Uncharacterized protein n=1 Tax=Didymella heteroderae TaxID=1769908 RepID=A0A9P4WSU6_9PLEO|nr:hypothetical protein E8E12_008813 [Didymella heteroderae]
MAPPTSESASPAAPPRNDAADIDAIAVRSDHLKAIIDFLALQSSVLNAAVPHYIYVLQGEAHRKYESLEPMLNKYKFPDDMVEVMVILANEEQQKVRISKRALTLGVNLGEGSRDNGTVKTSQALSAKQASSETVDPSDARSSRQYNAFKPATSPKQTSSQPSFSYKRRVSTDTHLSKSDMRKTLEKPNKIRVVPPKNLNPFQLTRAREPVLASRKTPKGSNTPARANVVKSEYPSFKFVQNSSRTAQNPFVYKDTPPKPTELATTCKTYSRATSSSGGDALPAKSDVEPHAVLKDKTNKGKASPKSVLKSSTKTSTHSQPTSNIIQRSTMTPECKVVAVNLKPMTAKRPCPIEELETKAVEDTSLESESLSEPGKTASPSCISVVDTKVDSARREAAAATHVAIIGSSMPERNEAAPNLDSSNPSAEGMSKYTTSTKPDRAATEAPQPQKGIARVIKKAQKRRRDREDDIIHNITDEEDAKSKRKAKKAKRSLEETSHNGKKTFGCEKYDEYNIDMSPKPRAAKVSKNVTNSPMKDSKYRSPEECDEKCKVDLSLAQENMDDALVLDGPQQRRARLSRPETSSTSSSPPRRTGPSKQTKTPNSSSTWEPLIASSPAAATPLPTVTQIQRPPLGSSASRTSRLQTEKRHPSKKQKATRPNEVHADHLKRASIPKSE